MPQRLSKQECRASRAEDILERLSVGRVRPTEKLVCRNADGSVEVHPVPTPWPSKGSRAASG